jgi:hypothetical protein
VLKVPQDEDGGGVLNNWAEATPSFVVQRVQERKPQEASEAGSDSKGSRRNLGSSPAVRKQQIALNYALDDLIEIIQCSADEEIKALAMRVQRLR